MNDDYPETESPEAPKAIIQITFPNGAHTTNLEMATSYVDAAQVELAGRFLIRQAESLYRQAEQIQKQRTPIVIAPAGSVPNA